MKTNLPSTLARTLRGAFCLAALAFTLGLATSARAQWISQTNILKPGWNAVYLFVDPSHDTLSNLVASAAGNPISEVWLWRPAPSTSQFIEDPAVPTGSGSQWASWVRTNNPSSPLQRLVANYAYLVRNTNSVNYNWIIKGKPNAPRYQWTSSGLNFLGFPTKAGAAPSFETFLGYSPTFQQLAEIFQYTGGELTNNPVKLAGPFVLRNTPVNRGEAFWIRATNYYNRYYGTFEVTVDDLAGIHLKDTASQGRFRVKNLTSSNLTITASRVASEPWPAGQTNITGPVPLLLRGPLNTTNLTYTYANLAASNATFTLAPGAETEVMVGVNRSTMSGGAGAFYASVLRLTDSFNMTQVDMGVSAEVASTAGLWVGGAGVTQVRQYLKNYERDSQGAPAVGTNGAYVITSVNTNLGTVAASYPLRLILHNSAGGAAKLLQRAYVGVDATTNLLISTRESALDVNQIASARRVSAVHLPFSAANTPWACSGQLQQGSSLTVTVETDYTDHAANPFLHTYHPDHDNLDVTFKIQQPQGFESYRISRVIKLTFTAPADDFTALTSGNTTLSGVYEESLTLYGRGTENRRFDSAGVFSLNRLSNVATLTQ